MGRWRKAALAVAIAIGAVGTAVALLAPVAWFDLVLRVLIGAGGHADTTLAQRLTAVVGAWAGALCVALLASDRTRATPPMPLTSRARVFGFVGVALFVGLNLVQVLSRTHVLTIAAQLAIWRPLRWVIALAGASVVVAFARASRAAPSRALLAAIAGGIGYGCFSGLWHCCPPPWRASDWRFYVGDFVSLSLAMTLAGRLGATQRAPVGEAMGALLLGLLYPWHTVPWFFQCALGGVLATQVVRRSESAWAPAAFLGSAFATHAVLPFIGALGPVVALVIVLALAPTAARTRPSTDASRRAAFHHAAS